jgi:hypothetical protein
MVIITVSYFVINNSLLTEENLKIATTRNYSAYETKKCLSELLKEKACETHADITTEIRITAELNGIKKEFVHTCCDNFRSQLRDII